MALKFRWKSPKLNLKLKYPFFCFRINSRFFVKKNKKNEGYELTFLSLGCIFAVLTITVSYSGITVFLAVLIFVFLATVSWSCISIFLAVLVFVLGSVTCSITASITISATSSTVFLTILILSGCLGTVLV